MRSWLVDGLLVGGQLAGDLGDGRGVGRHPGRGHRSLLAGGVDLELLEDQPLGDGGGLRAESRDLVGPRGTRADSTDRAGQGNQHREEHGTGHRPTVSRCVELRHRRAPGRKHKMTTLPHVTLITSPDPAGTPDPHGTRAERAQAPPFGQHGRHEPDQR